MIVTRKAIPRRTVLRGLGASLALPLLDGMVPALTAMTNTAAAPTRRFSIVYVPNGIVMKNWTPTVEGTAFEFTPILKPLEPFREYVNVVSGLHHKAADSTAVHSLSPTTWLSGVRPKPTQGPDADLRGVRHGSRKRSSKGRGGDRHTMPRACGGTQPNNS